MFRVFGIFGLLALLSWGHPALALESAPVVTRQVTASLVSDTDRAAAGVPLRVGLLLKLAPGWHVYWRNPGESGLPPEIRLDLPQDARSGPIAWPAPERLTEDALAVYAYTGQVLLAQTVTPSAGGLSVRAQADWLVCKTICIPQQGSFRLDLPAGAPSPSPAPSAQAGLFAAAERTVPRVAPWTATIAPDGTLAVRGAELGPATVRGALFVPDQEGPIVDAAAQPVRVVPGGLTLSLKCGKGFRPDQPLAGVLILRDGAGLRSAVALRAEPGPVPALFRSPAVPLWRLWLLAFGGGAILNLMPCVFPVLAMKVLGLAAPGGRRNAHALGYAAGVLASFAALGGALLLVRGALGAGAGWGFQFASPAFVAATCWVMLAVGLNLSGVFRVGAGRLAGAGQGLAARGGHLGSFFTGVLAVLVATPCTAPFMAAAVAGALIAPPLAGLSVFLAMGAGLAVPYVVLARLPGLARLMPRPGPWMERLRRVLALPMYGSAAWLLWVLFEEAGPSGLAWGGVGLVLVGVAAFVLGGTQESRRVRIGAVAAGACVLAALALLPAIGQSPALASEAGQFLAGAEPFTPARLAALRAEGRPVFVDMTASWCLTCLVNERVALDSPAVRHAFAERNVAVLVGDWTRQPAGLTAFLRANGRDGVPLYLYFPARAAAPRTLPQVLTAGTVVSAIGSRG